jgi:hypothetical protein
VYSTIKFCNNKFVSEINEVKYQLRCVKPQRICLENKCTPAEVLVPSLFSFSTLSGEHLKVQDQLPEVRLFLYAWKRTLTTLKNIIDITLSAIAHRALLFPLHQTVCLEVSLIASK